MKSLKNLVLATLALWSLTFMVTRVHAQSFCTWIGDGLGSTRYQQITELIPMSGDMAFAAWEGDVLDDMETFVGRVSTTGNLIWGKSYNLIPNDQEKANALLRTQNGNLIFASSGLNNFGIAKVSGIDGTSLVSKFFDEAYEIVDLFEQPNGNILAFGTYSNAEVVAMQFDANLNFLGGMNTMVVCSLSQVIRSGSNFYGVGSKWVGNSTEGVVFQLNSSFTPIWVSSITTGLWYNQLRTIGQFNGGSIIVAGYDGQCNPVNNGRIIMHVYTSAGAYVSSKAISTPSHCLLASNLKILANGNIIVVGQRGFANDEIVTIGLTNQGNLIQANRNGYGKGNCLAVSNANQVFIAGEGETFVNPLGWIAEGYLAGLDNQGNSCCSEPMECTIESLNLPTSSPQQPPKTPFTIAGTNQGTNIPFGLNTFYCPVAKQAAPVVTESADLFPNPANTEFNISISEELGATMQVYDLKGQIQIEQHLHRGTQTIPVEDLESGLYLVRITSANGIRTHRLAIAR